MAGLKGLPGFLSAASVKRWVGTITTPTDRPSHRAAWGALLAGFANASLFSVGSHFVPDGLCFYAAVVFNALAAGFAAPRRPAFAAAVLTLTGPSLFGHSPQPLGGIFLHLLPGCMEAARRGACLSDAALAAEVLILSFSCAFPVYWCQVRVGASTRPLLRRISAKQLGPLG